MLEQAEAVERHTDWRPSPAALAACALATGIFYFCGLTAAPVPLVLLALAGMVLVPVVCLRWIRRPGLRRSPLAGPDLSWKAMWPTVSLVLVPPLLLPLRGELHGVSGTIIAVVLAGLVASLTAVLFVHEARRA